MRRGLISSLASLGLVFLLWELAKLVARSTTFPGFLDVLVESVRIASSLDFFIALLVTLGLTSIGLLIGVLIAYFISLIVVQSSFIDNSSRLIINFLRSLPVIVLMPLTLVILGPGIESVIILTAFAIASKLVVFVTDGLRSVSVTLVQFSTIANFSTWERFFYIQIPSSFRFLMSGLQLSVSRAYGTVVLCGLLLGSPGIGKGLKVSREDGDIVALFSYGLILALIGLLIYSIVEVLEKRLLSNWGEIS